MSQKSPVLLWMHGGGLTSGVAAINPDYVRFLIEALGIAIVSVEYRLAPEHPFPAALEDCYAAFRWLTEAGGQNGFDPNRVIVGGESAGGGLAASLVQYLRDKAGAQAIFQLLVYPMLDDRTSFKHRDLASSEWIFWTPESNRFGWRSYLRGAQAPVPPPYSVPARRQDLSGLPPAWLGIGSLDLFYEEGVSYAKSLLAAGVACDLKLVPGAYHGFDQFNSQLAVVGEFWDSQVQAIRRILA